MVLGGGSTPLFQVGFTSDGDGPIIRLEGELDLATACRVDEALSLALRDDPPVVVVDLSNLSFMDSTGIRCLLRMQEQCGAEGRRLLLVPGGRAIQRVLEVSGVVNRFEYVITDDAPDLT